MYQRDAEAVSVHALGVGDTSAKGQNPAGQFQGNSCSRRESILHSRHSSRTQRRFGKYSGHRSYHCATFVGERLGKFRVIVIAVWMGGLDTRAAMQRETAETNGEVRLARIPQLSQSCRFDPRRKFGKFVEGCADALAAMIPLIFLPC